MEFFAQPKTDRGYFNFEFNCGGAFLCMYITNPERTPDGFKEFVKVPVAIGQTIQARSSLPQRVEPEITTPVVWTLSFFIPLALFEHYLGPLGVSARPGLARQFLQVRRRKLAPALGLVVAGGRIQLPPAELLWLDSSLPESAVSCWPPQRASAAPAPT